jgi:hypothetical protein
MEQQVVGLITYYDIERSRPHRLSPAAVAVEPCAICVNDVMTPWNELAQDEYESLMRSGGYPSRSGPLSLRRCK